MGIEKGGLQFCIFFWTTSIAWPSEHCNIILHSFDSHTLPPDAGVVNLRPLQSFPPPPCFTQAMATALANSPPLSPSPPLPNRSLKVQNGNHENGHLPEWESLDICISPGVGNIRQRPARRRKGKDASLTGTFRTWIVNHQIGSRARLPPNPT